MSYRLLYKLSLCLTTDQTSSWRGFESAPLLRVHCDHTNRWGPSPRITTARFKSWTALAPTWKIPPGPSCTEFTCYDKGSSKLNVQHSYIYMYFRLHFFTLGYKYDGVKFERGNCGVSIMRSGELSLGSFLSNVRSHVFPVNSVWLMHSRFALCSARID